METYPDLERALAAFNKLAVRPELADFEERLPASAFVFAPPPFRVEVQDRNNAEVGGTISVILRDADDVVLRMRGVIVKR